MSDEVQAVVVIVVVVDFVAIVIVVVAAVAAPVVVVKITSLYVSWKSDSLSFGKPFYNNNKNGNKINYIIVIITIIY